ncbi:hypothetical protein OAL53_01840 [Akkermansiaceae bacterium]|nr:hypothetical protein [Akkermansiaceae bacterium]MDA7532279.1 hypothetical protein [Akkermansiaceae bacterium]MDA7647248.1 hypothetical protein [Akkermansiaceae bacterium]MDA7658907.1 hypothetical protein [Akkermansiaceae bacterium]MDB4719070.1 hypothetical protein [Akkermansiaceae bacterium]
MSAEESICFEIKNYQRIFPVGADGATLSTNDDGAVFTDEADFVFDGIEVHIKCIEDSKGVRKFINHRYPVEEIDDEFLKLFISTAYDFFMNAASESLTEDAVNGPVDLEHDWGWILGDGEFDKLVKAYRTSSFEQNPDRITKKIAEKFLKDSGSVKLSEKSSMDDTAAEVLSKHMGSLKLDGLTELSDAAAESLSKYKGLLILSGLTELSDAAAQALAQHKGKLDLGGLTELSDAAAQALEQHKGKVDLGRKMRLMMAQQKAHAFVRRLEQPLTRSQALAQHKGKLLLNDLTELSDAAAQALVQHKGGLSLNGLTELSDAAAQALAQHKGELILGGLKVLSAAAAQALAKHEGEVDLGRLRFLSESGAQALAKHPNLSVSNKVQAQIDKFRNVIGE